MLRSKFKAGLCFVLAAVFLLGSSGCGRKKLSVPEQDIPEPYIPPYSSEDGSNAEEEAVSSAFSISYHPDDAVNPYLLKTQTNRIVSCLIYEGLFSVTPQFESEKVLCESCETDNGKDFTITVRQGVYFHDGAELTAEDVVYSLRLARSSEQYSSRLACISNLSVGGTYDLTVSLSSANTALPLLLDVPIIRSGEGDNPAPAGTGPYIFKDSAVLPVLRAYSLWPGNASLSLKTIGLVICESDELSSAFETGETDIALSDPAGISFINYGGDNESWYYDTTSLQYIGFNTDHLFLGNDWARRAVALAIDRDGIANECMSGCASVSTIPISPVSPLWSETADKINRYSLQEMSELLIEHETSDTDGDGFFEYKVTGIDVSFKIDFIVNVENANRVEAARKIASTLRNAGFDITLRELSWDDYVSALTLGNFDMYYGEVLLTPDFDLTALLTTGGSLNYGKASLTECRELIESLKTANEPRKKSAAADLYKYLAEYCPIAPILFRREAVLTHRGAVSGAQPTQYNPFNAIEEWIIKTE